MSSGPIDWNKFFEGKRFVESDTNYELVLTEKEKESEEAFWKHLNEGKPFNMYE